MSIARNLWYHLSLYVAVWQSNSPPEQKLFHMCQLIMPCHHPKWQQTKLLVLEGGFPTPEQTVLERKAANIGLKNNVLLPWIPWTKKWKLFHHTLFLPICHISTSVPRCKSTCGRKLNLALDFSKYGKQKFLKSWNLGVFFWCWMKLSQ